MRLPASKESHSSSWASIPALVGAEAREQLGKPPELESSRQQSVPGAPGAGSSWLRSGCSCSMRQHRPIIVEPEALAEQSRRGPRSLLVLEEHVAGPRARGIASMMPCCRLERRASTDLHRGACSERTPWRCAPWAARGQTGGEAASRGGRLDELDGEILVHGQAARAAATTGRATPPSATSAPGSRLEERREGVRRAPGSDPITRTFASDRLCASRGRRLLDPVAQPRRQRPTRTDALAAPFSPGRALAAQLHHAAPDQGVERAQHLVVGIAAAVEHVLDAIGDLEVSRTSCVSGCSTLGSERARDLERHVGVLRGELDGQTLPLRRRGACPRAAGRASGDRWRSIEFVLARPEGEAAALHREQAVQRLLASIEPTVAWMTSPSRRYTRPISTRRPRARRSSTTPVLRLTWKSSSSSISAICASCPSTPPRSASRVASRVADRGRPALGEQCLDEVRDRLGIGVPGHDAAGGVRGALAVLVPDEQDPHRLGAGVCVQDLAQARPIDQRPDRPAPPSPRATRPARSRAPRRRGWSRSW